MNIIVKIHYCSLWKPGRHIYEIVKKIGTVLMDLSKAFDCMPHSLLEIKLKACGVGKNCVELIKSYLQGRNRQVKIGENYST